MEDLFDFCLYDYILCQRGKKHFVVHLWRTRPVYFSPKDREDAEFEGKKDRKLFVSRQSWTSMFVVSMTEVVIPICTMTWHVHIFLSCHRKGILSINENTFFRKFIPTFENQLTVKTVKNWNWIIFLLHFIVLSGSTEIKR